MMQEMIEAIRAATADGATAEQKAHGAQACRTILAALEAEPGKPIAMPGAPAPGPLAGISPDQALDLLIAKLRSIVPDEGKAADPARAPDQPGLRIALVQAPPRPASAAQRPARRKP